MHSAPGPQDARGPVLAVDPGSHKAGYALVLADGQVAVRGIVPIDGLLDTLRTLIAQQRPRALLIGGGAGSGAILRSIREARLPLEPQVVDERRSTELARERYMAEHPARGWRRLVPKGLRTPGRPVDDYAAVLLAERYLAGPA